MNNPVLLALPVAGAWITSIMIWMTVIYLVCQRLGYDYPEVRSFLIEIRPLYYPSAALNAWDTMSQADTPAWSKAWILFGVFVGWYLLKSLGDDDRWKRRRKKLLEKVSSVGGRLVITPA